MEHPSAERSELTTKVAACLEAIRAGQQALNELFEIYRPFLRAEVERKLARKSPEQRGDASDFVNDTLLLAHRGFPRFRGSTEAKLWHWLCRILHRRVITASRRSRRDIQDHALESKPGFLEILPSPAPSPSSEAIGHEQADGPEDLTLRHTLTQALVGVDPEERLVFLLRARCRLPYEEIGQYLDCSADAARQRFNRVVDRLSADENLRRFHHEY